MVTTAEFWQSVLDMVNQHPPTVQDKQEIQNEIASKKRDFQADQARFCYAMEKSVKTILLLLGQTRLQAHASPLCGACSSNPACCLRGQND